MKPLPEIRVTIAPEDVARCGGYMDCARCLLATTLTRRGYKVVSVGPNMVTLSKRRYFSIDDPAVARLASRAYPHLAGLEVVLTHES